MRRWSGRGQRHADCSRVFVGLLLGLAMPLSAQDATGAHVVRGVVFDSISHAPLAGATVHVAPRDARGRPRTTTTDDAGRFRIEGLPSGRFVIGFYHDALTVLGLDAPSRDFALDVDTTATVDIGVPSGAVVHALLCGADSTQPRTAMLVGRVRRASDGVADQAATVTIAWRAIVLERGNFRTVTQRAVATTSADGTYSLCGLPGDAPLELRVAATGRREVVGPITVPSSGVARQDIRLADAAVETGAGRVAGIVVHEDGSPVVAGRAVLGSLARDVPVENGSFVLTDLPPGTWLVEVRAVGLEPRSMLMDDAEHRTGLATITLDDRAQRLDVVTIVGKPDRNTRILEEVLARSRTSFGTVFLPGSPGLQSAEHVADVLRAARGFTFRSPTEVYGRRTATGFCGAVAVYLNGAIHPGGFEDLDNMVSVRDVLAVEAYPEIGSAPIQWRLNRGAVFGASGKPTQACAVVLIWTRQR